MVLFPLGVTTVTRLEKTSEVVNLMERQGHAVSLDVTYEANGKTLLAARVTHFRTCARCAEIQREKERQDGKQVE